MVSPGKKKGKGSIKLWNIFSVHRFCRQFHSVSVSYVYLFICLFILQFSTFQNILVRERLYENIKKIRKKEKEAEKET